MWLAIRKLLGFYRKENDPFSHVRFKSYENTFEEIPHPCNCFEATKNRTD